MEIKLLKIVVASPGDVQAERDALKEVVEEINDGVAAILRLHLELVRWETHTYPGFHSKGPLGLSDLTLCIEDSDIFIGILWKRFGTPTKDALSGTEHEFRVVYNAWKEKGRPHIMFYFNQKPYNPQSSEEVEQWVHVLKFQENFPDEGLWWSYEGERDFEKQVRKHLTQLIRHHYEFSGRKFLPSRLVGLASLITGLWKAVDPASLAIITGLWEAVDPALLAIDIAPEYSGALGIALLAGKKVLETVSRMLNSLR